MVEQLGMRELRANLATVLRRAGQGERIVITVAGDPVAQLGPLDPVDGAVTMDDLAVRRLLAPRPGDLPDRTEVSAGAHRRRP